MRGFTLIGRTLFCVAAFTFVAAVQSASAQAAASAKVPVTTSSSEARDLYLKGRDLAEKLRGTDARQYYQQAVVKDGALALREPGDMQKANAMAAKAAKFNGLAFNYGYVRGKAAKFVRS